ncbi:MAG: biotin--[acetyl-CoA-carboxylase] ligase [Syntrophomonadaceae bacterium]|nr:biotin--[acetyl-CoA-carboxylase] ligase [Syntrophomonadaceae bacterium]
MNLREAVLTALKEKKGEWISGEGLSESLGVSRTAVWKQVRHLLAEGYAIESSPKKGYRICAPADILSPAEVCPGLATQVLGRRDYIYFREIDSTNNRARLLASQGYPEGTVVVAEMQTAGRGRRGRDWYSPVQQGIYVSVILRPELPLKEISRVSLVTAAAVAQTLESELGLNPRIKWPNDVLVDNKKIAGMLSEAVTDMDGVEYIVVGIGLNINNDIQEFPPDLRTAPTSARALNHRSNSRVKILQGLLRYLEYYYQQLLAGNFAVTLEKAKSLSTVIGREVRLDNGKDFIAGQAVDIDDNGFLLVRDRQGIIHTIMSGEIDE